LSYDDENIFDHEKYEQRIQAERIFDSEFAQYKYAKCQIRAIVKNKSSEQNEKEWILMVNTAAKNVAKILGKFVSS
jgi:hypothetical protein